MIYVKKYLVYKHEILRAALSRVTVRASTGLGMGPGRGFRKSSGLRLLTGPGLQYIYYIKRFCQAEIDRNNVMAMLVDL